MPCYVALFRALNLGARNRVKMPELLALHEELGFQDSVSIGQTGNIVFTASETESAKLVQLIEPAFQKQFGFESRVVVRTKKEMSALFNANPVPDLDGKKAQWLSVIFLQSALDATALKAFLEKGTGPDEVHPTRESANLIIYHSKGMAGSRVNEAVIAKKFGVAGTARNWNTVTKIVEALSDRA